MIVFANLSLVMATYQGEGTSVTNECEQIATEVVRQHRLKPDRILFIEHYPAGLWANSEETFKLITFHHDGERFTNPEWIPLENQSMKDLLDSLLRQQP